MYRAGFRFKFLWSSVMCTVDTALHHTETCVCVCVCVCVWESDTLCLFQGKKILPKENRYDLRPVGLNWQCFKICLSCPWRHVPSYITQLLKHVPSHNTQLLKARTISHHSFCRHVTYYIVQFLKARTVLRLRHVPSYITRLLKARAILRIRHHPKQHICQRHLPSYVTHLLKARSILHHKLLNALTALHNPFAEGT
jgi:hypothetical protein